MHVSYQTIDERPTLRFERTLRHPMQAVWEAITRPEELAQWFPTAVEVDLRVGGRMTFVFPETALPEQPATMTGEVTELSPPRRLSFTWGEDHLHFALEPVDDGHRCLLRFTVELDSVDKAARDAAGWHVCLDALQKRLDGTELKRPYPQEDWRGHYEEYRRRGFPARAPIPSSTEAG